MSSSTRLAAGRMSRHCAWQRSPFLWRRCSSDHCLPPPGDFCASSACRSAPSSGGRVCKVDPACWDHIVPFEARFLEELGLNKLSQPSEFEGAVAKVFEEIDRNSDGAIDRHDLEKLMRTRVYVCCPAHAWAMTPDQLMERLGATRQKWQIQQEDFATAMEKMADTLDRRVWPIATSQFFSALMFAVNQPLMPLLVKELGINMTQFGGMVAIMPLVRIGLAMPSTYLVNTYGRKPLTVEGQLVAAVGFGLSAFITSPLQLVLTRITVGAGTSFAGVGQQTMLGDIASGRTRSRVFGPGQMRSSAAFALGPTLGGWLAASCGVQNVYLLIGAGMALVSLRNRCALTETLRFKKHESSSTETSSSPPVLEQLPSVIKALEDTINFFWKDKVLRDVTIANFGLNATAISSKFVLLPMLALDHWGLGPLQLGMMLGVMSLIQCATARPAAYVADIYGRDMALIPGLILTNMALASAASGLPTETVIPIVCSTWALGSSFFGLVPAAVTLDACGRHKMDQEGRARALSMTRVLSDVGMVVGCVTAGLLLHSGGAQSAFCVQASLLAALTTGVTASLLRR